ncbi:MAG: MFS transporter, partial [Bacteroidales bacterium]|nr:MFS transporter [Bacteroidales bacterium]
GADIFLTCAVYLTIGEIGQMAGVAFAVPFSEKIGKRNTFILAMAAVVLFSCLIWFIPQGNSGIWWLIVLQVLVSLAFGLAAPLTWSMFADVADYSELKHGNNSTGLIFSSSSMAQKFGGAIGGFILLALLGVFDYDKDLVLQAPRTLGAIKAMMSFVPAMGAALSIIFLAFYPLTTGKMKDIQARLQVMRGERQ